MTRENCPEVFPQRLTFVKMPVIRSKMPEMLEMA